MLALWASLLYSSFTEVFIDDFAKRRRKLAPDVVNYGVARCQPTAFIHVITVACTCDVQLPIHRIDLLLRDLSSVVFAHLVPRVGCDPIFGQRWRPNAATPSGPTKLVWVVLAGPSSNLATVRSYYHTVAHITPISVIEKCFQQALARARKAPASCRWLLEALRMTQECFWARPLGNHHPPKESISWEITPRV